MLNILRADIYRLLHGKTIYVTLAATIVLSLLITFGAFGPLATLQDVTSMVDGQGTNLVFATDTISWLTGPQALRNLPYYWYIFIYLLIPVAAAGAAAISSGAIKNSLTTGVSRVKLYLAAWVINVVLCVALYVVFLGSGFAAASITQGLGDRASSGADLRLDLRVAVAQVLAMLAVSSVGVLLNFAVRRQVIAIAVLALFILLPQVETLVSLILPTYSLDFVAMDPLIPGQCYQYPAGPQGWLDNTVPTLYLPTTQGWLPFINVIPCVNLWQTGAMSLAWIAASTLAGIGLFSRAEAR